MKVKNFIGKSVNGFTILNTYPLELPSGKKTRRVLLKCDNCNREFERNSGVNFEHIKCKCMRAPKKKKKFVYYELNGKKYTQTELCKTHNITVGTFRSRLKCGLSLEEALQKEFVCKCEICEKEFIANRPHTKYCSNTCYRRAGTGKGKYKQVKTFKCVVCGKEFNSIRDDAKTCCEKCRSDLARIDRNKRYAHLKEIGHFDYSVTLSNVFDRFNGECQICHKVLNFNCDSKSSDYPSIDHIKPLSKGGFHEWNNVQLLCRGCNCKKSNGV
jgi:predicted nucleic acid-binding Zn ribbon protein